MYDWGRLILKQYRNRFLTRGRARKHFRRKVSPVFLVTTGRSGSNYMVDLLNSVPNVKILGEVLSPFSDCGVPESMRNPKLLRKHVVYSVRAIEEPISGAKIHIEHLQARKLPVSFLDHCFPAYKIILLFRNSLFDQYISWKMAKTNNIWIATDTSKISHITLSIKPQEFRQYVAKQEQRFAEVVPYLLCRNNVFVLSFEELVASPQAIFDKYLFAFLGVDPISVCSSLQRQRRRAVGEVVKNIDDLQDYIDIKLTSLVPGMLELSKRMRKNTE